MRHAFSLLTLLALALPARAELKITGGGKVEAGKMARLALAGLPAKLTPGSIRWSVKPLSKGKDGAPVRPDTEAVDSRLLLTGPVDTSHEISAKVIDFDNKFYAEA